MRVIRSGVRRLSSRLFINWLFRTCPDTFQTAGNVHAGQGLKQAYSLSFAFAGKIMGTSVQQIDALLTVRAEDEHLEFKVAENCYDFEELVDYCVALANEGGGRITDPTQTSEEEIKIVEEASV